LKQKLGERDLAVYARGNRHGMNNVSRIL
jgi:hypothetical protein